MTNEGEITNQNEPPLPEPIKNQTAKQKQTIEESQTTSTKEQTETRVSMAKTTGHHHIRIRW